MSDDENWRGAFIGGSADEVERRDRVTASELGALGEDREPVQVHRPGYHGPYDCAPECIEQVAESMGLTRRDATPDEANTDRAAVHRRLVQALKEFGEVCLADSKRWYPEIHSRSADRVLNHVAMGIGGEAGEVVDVFKKVDVCGSLSETCDHHKDGKHSDEALGSEVFDLLVYLSEALVLSDLATPPQYLARFFDQKHAELVERNEVEAPPVRQMATPADKPDPVVGNWCRNCELRIYWEAGDGFGPGLWVHYAGNSPYCWSPA